MRVLPRFAREAFEDQHAIRVVEGVPEVSDTLYLIQRAEWPLSARAQRALSVMREAVAGADTAL